MKPLFKFSLLFLFLGIWACEGSDDTPNNGGDDDTPSGIEIPSTGYNSPASYPGFTLVWEEQFEGEQLSADWTYDLGTGEGGWGNNELQSYTRDNITMQDGHVIITARQQLTQESNYTSSRIKTQGRKNFQYGRIDVRAVLPRGQGMWPAVWMLGSNIDNVGWPLCGEIDIMEMVGGSGRENTVHGTVHWQGDNGHEFLGGETSLDQGTFNDEFHVFSIEWSENEIIWFVDGEEYHRQDTSPVQMDEFRNDYFFILNLAVGGQWPGAPNNTTSFPQHFIVDFIKVFEQD